MLGFDGAPHIYTFCSSGEIHRPIAFAISDGLAVRANERLVIKL